MVNVKFMALTREGEVSSGVFLECPSIQSVRDAIEKVGGAVIYAEEATAEDIEAHKEA